VRGAAGQETARSDILLLVGCTALALLAIALPRSWGLSVATDLRQTALRPLVALQARAEHDRRSRFELAQVQRSHDSLAVLVQQQDGLRRENENLRGLIGVRARLSHPSVSAEVLHRPSVIDTRMLLLDVGTSDGVRVFDPIVTAEGLIGSIVSAGSTTSSAITWANPDFSASAITADGNVTGFIHPSTSAGLSGPILELHGIAQRDSLAIGTVVLTAGAGGTYPRGIPIGRVVSIGRDENGYDRIYRVIPFASPGGASHVVVLTSPRDSIYPRPRPATQPPVTQP
jgi:rod shape-determining protein MreC